MYEIIKLLCTFDWVQVVNAITDCTVNDSTPDSKLHGANMGPIWGQQDAGGPHVGPMNLAIWDSYFVYMILKILLTKYTTLLFLMNDEYLLQSHLWMGPIG